MPDSTVMSLVVDSVTWIELIDTFESLLAYTVYVPAGRTAVYPLSASALTMIVFPSVAMNVTVPATPSSPDLTFPEMTYPSTAVSLTLDPLVSAQ